MSIEVKNVTYVYMPKTPFERVALADVSLTIPEGSFTAIAGHTGSGKSTLVQHLNGLLTPTSGAVLVDGVNIGDKSKTGRQQAQTARQQVGMVFQYAEHQLFEESIAADIAFGPANQELSAEEIDQRVREAMGIVGLDYDTYHDRSPFSLSGGQMRRAAIAGVLAMRPKYLVLDEPAAGLDPSGREELLQQIKRLHKEQNMTIVMVSHSMEYIAKLADNVIIMAQGKVYWIDLGDFGYGNPLLDFSILSPETIVYDDSAPEEIISRIQGACAVVTKELPVPAEMIEQFPDSVKLICEAGTGYNNIDIAI